MRAKNAEGTSVWSDSGTGSTDASVPKVKIEAEHESVTEGADVVFNLTAKPAPPEKIMVQVTVAATGSLLTNPLPADGIIEVTIEAGKTKGQLSLATTNDEIDERDGAVAAIISVGEGYTFGDPLNATTAILDDDKPPTPSGLRANGNLVNGNVTLRWTPISGATGYNFRYTEDVCVEVDQDADRDGEKDYTCGPGSSPTWNTIAAQNVTTDGDTAEAILGGLVAKSLYRVEVQSVIVDASEWSAFTLVFPTDSPPDRETTVATANLSGYKAKNANGSHEYRFKICRGTIDTDVAWTWDKDEQGDPVRDERKVGAIATDIENAAETWETTVRWVVNDHGDNIVSATPTRSETCPSTGFVAFVPRSIIGMYCGDASDLGCAGRDHVFLTKTPMRRVEPSKDDLEPTTWDLMENGCSYLHKVMMHEAGHHYGIGGHPHPGTPQAVMFGSVSGWGERFCNPQVYDVAAMMANYQSR